MSSILLSLPEIYEKYKNWVKENPQRTGEYETVAKYISFIIAGKINNSHIISELVYCASNLLVLFNDRIIRQIKEESETPESGDKLKLWLTVVEYCEVLFEMSAMKCLGATGKWLIITIIQLFKCVSRFLLIYKYKESVIQTPPIAPLERSTLISTKNSEINDGATFKLRSSGRVVRKIDGAPSCNLRVWKPLQNNNTIVQNNPVLEKSLEGRLLIAESIYVIKPIVHLATAHYFGLHKWKPWVIALLLDLASLQIYYSYKKQKALNDKQRLQLSKRTLVLVMYLVRSPFYDEFSKDRIESFLMALSKNIPLAKLLCKPLMAYLPFWQSNYFYMWSS